jgi:hypothetical protein
MSSENWISITSLGIQVLIASYIALTVQKSNAKINVMFDLEKSHRNEERNVIIDFYGKYQQWFFGIVQTNIGFYAIPVLKELIISSIKIDAYYADSGISQAKIKLLVKDNEIVKRSENLLLEIYKFHRWMEDAFVDLRFNIGDDEEYTTEMKNVTGDSYYDNENKTAFSRELKRVRDERKEIIKDFNDKKDEFINKITVLDNEFTEKVKEHLTHLIQ